MKLKNIIATSILMTSAFSLTAQAEQTEFKFSDIPESQKQEIAVYVSNYLAENPQFLVKASENLEKLSQEEKEKSYTKKAELANKFKEEILSKDTPILKNKDAKYTIAVFADYNCSYCLMFNKTLKALEKNKNFNIAFKELPIFGDQTNSSFVAANVGINIFKEKGIDSYLAYHNDVYDFIEKNAKLTDNDVVTIAKKYDYTPKESDMKLNLELVMPNFELGQKLGINATPSYVIFGSTPDNTKFIEGYLSEENLNKAIENIK